MAGGVESTRTVEMTIQADFFPLRGSLPVEAAGSACEPGMPLGYEPCDLDCNAQHERECA